MITYFLLCLAARVFQYYDHYSQRAQRPGCCTTDKPLLRENTQTCSASGSSGTAGWKHSVARVGLTQGSSRGRPTAHGRPSETANGTRRYSNHRMAGGGACGGERPRELRVHAQHLFFPSPLHPGLSGNRGMLKLGACAKRNRRQPANGACAPRPSPPPSPRGCAGGAGRGPRGAEWKPEAEVPRASKPLFSPVRRLLLGCPAPAVPGPNRPDRCRLAAPPRPALYGRGSRPAALAPWRRCRPLVTSPARPPLRSAATMSDKEFMWALKNGDLDEVKDYVAKVRRPGPGEAALRREGCAGGARGQRRVAPWAKGDREPPPVWARLMRELCAVPKPRQRDVLPLPPGGPLLSGLPPCRSAALLPSGPASPLRVAAWLLSPCPDPALLVSCVCICAASVWLPSLCLRAHP